MQNDGGEGVACPSQQNTQPDPASSAVLVIALFSVVERQSIAKAHEARWWDKPHEDALADGSLPVLGGRRSRAQAHRAALAERRRRPPRKQQPEHRSARLPFTSIP